MVQLMYYLFRDCKEMGWNQASGVNAGSNKHIPNLCVLLMNLCGHVLFHKTQQFHEIKNTTVGSVQN